MYTPQTPSVNQYLSLSWLHQNRYSFSRDIISEENIRQLNASALETLGVPNASVSHYKYSKDKKVDICDWVSSNCNVEAHLYDYIVPTSFVTPLSFFNTNKPWNILLFCFDPYKTKQPHKVLTSPQFISTAYQEKDDPYTVKTFFIEDIELGWVGYDIFDDCIFVHHIQVRGALKGLLTNNELLWLYRYMIRLFVQWFEGDARNKIFVPDAKTIHKLITTKNDTSIPFLPFSSHVLEKSNFKKINGTTFNNLCPVAINHTDIYNYVNKEDAEFWRFKNDTSHYLAGTHTNRR